MDARAVRIDVQFVIARRRLFRAIIRNGNEMPVAEIEIQAGQAAEFHTVNHRARGITNSPA